RNQNSESHVSRDWKVESRRQKVRVTKRLRDGGALRTSASNFLDLRQIARALLHARDDLGDAIHVGAAAEELGLTEPECVRAELVVDRALVAVDPFRHRLFSVDTLIMLVRGEGLHVRGGVQRRVTGAGSDTFLGERREELRARQPRELPGIV